MSLSDHFKYKGYTYNLNEDNLENDMHAVISDYNKLQSDLLSRYIFSNIDRICHYPVMKLIFAVNNFANDNGEKAKPLIVYSANDHPIYLNDWEDEHYFDKRR